jgi:hypothetical protein
MKSVLRNVILPATVIYLFLAGTGLLLTHPLARFVRGEDGINRDLAAHRTSTWSEVTAVFGTLANTTAIVATVAVLALILRLVYGRWRESLTLVAAVALQAVELPVRAHGCGDGAVRRAGRRGGVAPAAPGAARAALRGVRRRPARGRRVPAVPGHAPPHRRTLRPAQRSRLPYGGGERLPAPARCRAATSRRCWTPSIS